MGLKTAVLGITLITVISVSTIVTCWWLDKSSPPSDFFVGVEFAYNEDAGEVNVLMNDLKKLVDKVKDYTNLFVIGSIEISFNQTALNEACDYIVDSGLHLIVLFTDSDMYNYTTFDWMVEARQKYGDMFLGVYRYDEPGGNQLDMSDSMLIVNETDYTSMAANYTYSLGLLINYYMNFADTVVTADYALYWFDYKAGYTSILTEFGWNHSRTKHIGLCRGAAEAFNRNWGAIITWKYTEEPYIESGEELYKDMVLAYRNGAKYLVIFDYPKIGQYGILTDRHLQALQDFWSYIGRNPQEHETIQGEAAYVLPRDYGFGFRNPRDRIWGLWEADGLSQKIWNDVNTLLEQYGSRLDIIYDEPAVVDSMKNRYEKLFFWNETIA